MDEILVLGERRPVSRRRRRTLAVVGLLAVAVVASSVLVDRQVRGQERRGVTACARLASEALATAGRPVLAAYDYVRPVLSDAPPPRLRRGMLRLVAERAAGRAELLEAAATRCRATDVLPFHRGLRDRRDRCSALLRRQAAALEAVAADGEAVARWLRLPTRC